MIATGPSSPYDAGIGYVGANATPPQTTLPVLPTMSNVVAALNDDSATVTFDPVDGALDYRIYPLPNDSDISTTADGHVVVHNGIYRCAGNRESPVPVIDKAQYIPSDGLNTQVDQETVGGYLRTLANATVGYVYTQPAPGLVPVYAVGESNANADVGCYFARWGASRMKLYTTSESARAQLLATFGRDDGIAFYVPSAPDSTTTQIYVDEQGSSSGTYHQRYYFPDGPEAAAHSSKQAAFLARATQVTGTMPLMRVFYSNQCGWSHDELAVGKERFNRIYKQGDQQPWWSLLWSGITGPTTLVVEALDTRCPFQGLPSSQSIPSVTGYFGTLPLIHQPFVTIDEMRAASASTEVFINGQNGPAWTWNGQGPNGAVIEKAPTAAQLMANTGAGLPLPKAVARSFVTVTPQPHPAMDFLATFHPGSAAETFTPITNGPPSQGCSLDWQMESPTFYAHFVCMDGGPTQGSGLYAFGPVMGELWVTMADNASDTNGKFRLTAKQMATMSASSFLHVTMEADSYSTARRYPQILISDQSSPVQYNLTKGHTLIVQPRGEISSPPAPDDGVADFPIDYNLQICNLRTWDVNNQCPQYDLYHVTDSTGKVLHLAPNDEVGEHASADHRVLYDVFVSTKRAYVFLDAVPYACADLPQVGAPQAGPVTVTWGDVLYHSAVDHTFDFHSKHMQIETHRHFDNLGFSSGVPAPGWDETRFPCAAPIAL
jgi:hypothetical protein